MNGGIERLYGTTNWIEAIKLAWEWSLIRVGIVLLLRLKFFNYGATRNWFENFEVKRKIRSYLGSLTISDNFFDYEISLAFFNWMFALQHSLGCFETHHEDSWWTERCRAIWILHITSKSALVCIIGSAKPNVSNNIGHFPQRTQILKKRRYYRV